jgi:hypothetical protein
MDPKGEDRYSATPPARLTISAVLFDISERKGSRRLSGNRSSNTAPGGANPGGYAFKGIWTGASIILIENRGLDRLCERRFDSRRLKWIDLIPAEEMDYVKQTL